MPSLAGDLKNIRRDHKLGIQDMYELTRIPLDILKAIEDGTLFEDESRNSTYIRSFVRTYAKSLKISEDDIVKALDDHIIGVYDGFLLSKYGSGPSKSENKGGETNTEASSSNSQFGSRFKLDLPEEEAETSEHEAEEEQTKPESESKPSDEEEDLFVDELDEGSDEPAKPEKAKEEEGNYSTLNREEFSMPDPEKPYNREVPEPPSVKSVDWAAIGKKTYSLSRRPGILLLLLLVIIVFAGVTFIVVKKMSKSSKQNAATNITTVDSLATPPLMTRSDSVKADLLPAENNKPALPDTLKLTIYAAFGPLGPVRVETDLARKLNPYWIDEGEGMRFKFLDSINVKGIFNNMILLYNGHPVDDFRKYVRNDDLLHLERSYFKNHPEWQTATHDTLPGGVPQPRVVRNEPRF